MNKDAINITIKDNPFDLCVLILLIIIQVMMLVYGDIFISWIIFCLNTVFISISSFILFHEYKRNMK